MKTILLGVILALAPLAYAQETLLSRSGPGIVEEMQHVNESDLVSDEHLTRIARDFLAKYPKKRIRHLILLTDTKDVLSLRRGRAISDITYTMWKDRYTERLSQISPQAELLSLGDAAALRVRTRDGKIEHIALTKNNPFEFKLRNKSIQIDFVSFKEVLHDSKPILQVAFFVQGKVRSEEEAAVVHRHLRSLANVPNIETRIAPDSWFLDDGDYPWANPYLEAGAIPSYEEYAKVTSFICESKSCTGLRAVAAR